MSNKRKGLPFYYYGAFEVGGVHQYEQTSDHQHLKVSEVISKPTTMMVSEQSQTTCTSQIIESHSHADKENVFEIKDLHECTININFNK